MSVENGGEQPANDTAVSDQTTQPAAADNTEATEGLDTEGTEGEQTEPEDEEVDYEGAKYRVPKSIKDALLRQADYTTKTQALAEQRKALEAERDGWGKTKEAQRSHFQDAAKVAALNERIGEVDAEIQKYQAVDWVALSQSNPDAYQQHRAHYDSLRDRKGAFTEQRDTAARAWTQKEQEYTDNANRSYGERVAKAQAELPKLIEGYNAELDQKLGQYGTSLGLSAKEMAEWTIQNPVAAKIMHKAMQFDELQKKQKTAAELAKTLETKPVTRVGGNGGSAARKTTDSSGDALSTAEWFKREQERVAALRRPSRGGR